MRRDRAYTFCIVYSITKIIINKWRLFCLLLIGHVNETSRANLLYRFPGDIHTPHVATPRRAKNTVQFLKDCISTGRNERKKLQRKLTAAENKVRTLKGVINRLHADGFLSPTVREKIFVSFDGVCFMEE